MIETAWCWQCTKCDRLLHWKDVVPGELNGERCNRHWDGLAEMWCGPVHLTELAGEKQGHGDI